MKTTNLFLAFVLAVLCMAGNSFAQAADAAAGGFNGVPTADQTATGIRTPVFLGAALGFGSGTGVGTVRGLGLRQIEPMLGVWLPGLGFLRAGYGFFNFDESVEDGDDAEVEHSDFDIEMGVHLFGELYVTGAYSRVKELSDVGDVAWNEWGVGFGTLLNVFSKTMLFAEVSYRRVLDHYDPFEDKNVSGSRLQFNIGFASYVL